MQATSAPFNGYEMHMGETTGPDTASPVLHFSDQRPDGATSPNGRVQGTYVHGLFSNDTQRAAFLQQYDATSAPLNHSASVDATLDALAMHLEAHINIDRLLML